MLDYDHIPRVTLLHSSESDSGSITCFAEMFCKPFGCKFLGENYSKVDIAGPTQVVSMRFQSPKSITVVVIRIIHSWHPFH